MKYLLLVVMLMMGLSLLAQGFNNDQLIDQEDLKFLFDQNKIQPFKFSFKANNDSSINIILEEYRAGKLVKINNLYKQLKPFLEMSDDPIYNSFPRLNDSLKHWIRFYIDETVKSGIKIWYKTGGLQTNFWIATPVKLITQARAYDNIPDTLCGRQQLLVFYGNKNKEMISCPGNARVKEVAKMYDLVVAIYAQPFKP